MFMTLGGGGIIIDTKPETMFLGSWSNRGLYISRDGGLTWHQSQTMKTGNIQAIGRAQNGNVIVGVKSGGVWYSEDDGETFTQCESVPKNMVIGTVFNANNGRILLGAGTRSYQNFNDSSDNNCTGYYSDDNGLTWTQIHNGPNNTDNDDFDTFSFGNNGRIFAGSDGNNFYYSDDNGSTWNGKEVGGNDEKFTYGIFKCSNGTLLTACNKYRCYYSRDNGNTWTASGKDENVSDIVELSNKRLVYVSLADIVIGYSDNCFSSNDWTYMGKSGDGLYGHNGYRCLLGQNDRVIIGSDVGIWYLDNFGTELHRSNITSGSFKVIKKASNNRLIAASKSNTGIYYSNDNGETWYPTNITDGNFERNFMASENNN